MTISPKTLYTGGQLTTSAATLYTSPANTKTIVTEATFTNVDTVARLLTVYIVRSGGTASAANTLISAKSIAAGEAYVSPELAGQILGPGDFIQAKADANTAITVAGISGYLVA